MAKITVRDVSGEIFERLTAKTVPVVFYPYGDPDGLGFGGTKDGRVATVLKVGAREGVIFAHFFDVMAVLCPRQKYINSHRMETRITGRDCDLTAFAGEVQGFKRAAPLPLPMCMADAGNVAAAAIDRARSRPAPREEAALQL